MSEALLMLFVFGGFWFWGLFGVASLLILLALEKESGGWAVFVAGVALAAMLGLGNSSWLAWLFENPLNFGSAVIGYAVVGVGYSIVKWRAFVCHVARMYRQKRTHWLQNRLKMGFDESINALYYEALKTGKLTGTVKEEWDEHLGSVYGWRTKKPEYSQSKDRITGWMIFWPWSCLWLVINDPVRRFFGWVYETLGGLYRSIADSAWEGIDD